MRTRGDHRMWARVGGTAEWGHRRMWIDKGMNGHRDGCSDGRKRGWVETQRDGDKDGRRDDGIMTGGDMGGHRVGSRGWCREGWTQGWM